MIVFGESTLNNAVSIALATSFYGIKLLISELDELNIVVFTIENFCTYFFLSFLIGATWAVITSFVFATLDLHEFTWIEIAMFTLSCYFPYIFCEAVGCSGVISIFVTGSFMRNYAFYSLGSCGKITIEYLVDTIGFTTENFIFAYLGVSIPLMLEEVNIYLTLVGIAVLMISRSVAVFSTSYFVSFFDKKVPFSHQIVFIYAGLRGSVAFYLALHYLADQEAILLPQIMSMILFTVIILGGTTVFVMKFLHRMFPQDKIFKDEDLSEIYEMDEQSLEEEVEKEENYVMSRLERFDREFLRKLLRKEGWELGENTVYFEQHEYPGSAENLDLSAEDKNSVFFRRTQNRGDLSPIRNSIMHQPNIPKKLNKEAAQQFSFRENFSKRFKKDDSFATPNKVDDRYSINFSRYRDNFSVMQAHNFLNAAMAKDNNIDFSASRRKSMRFLSQRKSKHDTKSDASGAGGNFHDRRKKRVGSSISPANNAKNLSGGKEPLTL